MTIISNPVKYNTGAGVGGSGGGGNITIPAGAGGSGSTITLTNTTGTGYTIGSGISSGHVYTTTSTNPIWTTGTSSIPNETIRINQTNPPTVDIKGNLVINDRDLEERLVTIEKVLQIPERDVKLEKKHPKLKKLYDEYINALGKYRTFEAIKGDDDGTT